MQGKLMKIRYFAVFCGLIFYSLLTAVTAFTQELLSEIHFESQNEIDTAAGVTSGGVLEIIPGISGNAVSLANADSLCFPAADIVNYETGTIQFWARDIAENAGLWEVTNAGTDRLWGAFRQFDTNGSVVTDKINYEMQTAAGRSAQSSGNWRQDPNWHFVVFTWTKGSTRTSFTVYTDSIRYSTPALFGAVSLAPDSMFCLGRYSTWQNSHAAIDELKSFNYVRSQTQINSDFSELFSGCPIWPYLWHNSLNAYDVNRDNVLDSFDALYVLSALASGATIDFSVCPDNSLPALALDVNPDNILNEQDAVSVVNGINASLPPEQQILLDDLRNLSHGDVNSDGTLNQDDLEIMVNNLGISVPVFTEGDITGDGLVDSSDIDILRKFISYGAEWRSLLPLFKIVRP